MVHTAMSLWQGGGAIQGFSACSVEEHNVSGTRGLISDPELLCFQWKSVPLAFGPPFARALCAWMGRGPR